MREKPLIAIRPRIVTDIGVRIPIGQCLNAFRHGTFEEAGPFRVRCGTLGHTRAGNTVFSAVPGAGSSRGREGLQLPLEVRENGLPEAMKG